MPELVEPRHAGRPRLLVVTPRFPFPPTGGDKVRIYHLSRVLAEHFDLTLASLHDDARASAPRLPPDSPFKAVHLVHLPRWRSWLNSFLALFGSEPLQVAYYRSPAFARIVDRLASQHDVLLNHLIRLAPYGRHAGVPRVLEMTDAISLNMQRAMAHPQPLSLRYWAYRIESRRLLGYERSVSRQFALVSLISRVDLDHVFGEAGEERAIVVPNGVMPAPAIRSGLVPDIVFIGNFASLQNRDALRFFAAEVLPRVREAVPAARLRVIGPMPAREGRRLGRLPGVLLLGQVPTLAPALEGAAVGVCPIRIGAGMQNKLLDYLAHGLPAITSPIGLEGLQAEPGRHLWIAAGIDEWVAKVLAVLRDPDGARSVAQRGRELVRERYRWAACTHELAQRLHALATAQAVSGEVTPRSTAC